MSNYIYISFISLSIFNKNSIFSISTHSGAPEVDWGGRWEERVFNWTLSLPGWLLPCTALRSPFPPELPVGVAMGFFPCPPQPLYTPDDPHKQQAWHTSLHLCLQGIWPKDKCYQTKYRTGPWLGGWGEMQLNSRARFWLPWWLSW